MNMKVQISTIHVYIHAVKNIICENTAVNGNIYRMLKLCSVMKQAIQRPMVCGCALTVVVYESREHGIIHH